MTVDGAAANHGRLSKGNQHQPSSFTTIQTGQVSTHRANGQSTIHKLPLPNSTSWLQCQTASGPAL
eukprot:6075127-Amphidinium_carterae.1